MSVYDLSLDELKRYLPERTQPADYQDFWAQTLAETRRAPLDARFEPVDFGLRTIKTFDVTYAGFAGQPIKAWFSYPAGAQGPLPTVVEFIGYGGGRGFPTNYLFWASMGFAHLVMDTRGQGSTWQRGDTPDLAPDPINPHIPGFMTSGVLDPHTYYYRRVFMDGVRAVEAARSHPLVDSNRLAITGGSQGGGVSLAVAGLEPTVPVVMPDVPFLCHFRRAVDLVDTDPYNEIVRFCHIHRDKVDLVFQNLSYFDGVNFAANCHARALFAVGLMDTICPPSTIFAAYNHFAGEKEIRIYPFNNHEGGGSDHDLEKVRFLRRLWNLEG